MASDLLLAIDVGTTLCKATLFDLEGKAVAAAREEYGILHPHPDWAEQDARQWWQAVCNTVGSLPERRRVRAAAVTSQREGLVPVDAQGRPLAHCILWMDRRTLPQCEAIRQAMGEDDLFAITGLRLDPAFSLPKLLWIRAHQPEVYREAAAFLQASDYINACLTGRRVTEHSIASRTMLLDIRTRAWSDRVLKCFGLDVGHLPQLLEPGTPVGELSAAASAVLGLPRETLVVAGGGDQQCNAVGAGAVGVGSASIGIGTATAPSVTLTQPLFDPQRRLPCCCAALPGHWELEPPIWTTGALLRWFRDELGTAAVARAQCEGVDPYEVLTAEAASIPPGAEGLLALPYFMGAGAPLWNPLARGAFFGLTLGHRRAHLVRALLEAVAYEIRLNVEAIEDLGWPLADLYLTGGGARSALWRTIIGDVTGKRILLPAAADAPALGVAMLAAVGAGLFPDVPSAARAMAHTRARLEPDAARHRLYSQYYALYRQVYAGLEPAYRKLGAIAAGVSGGEDVPVGAA